MKKCLIVIVLLIGVLSCRTDRTDDYEIKVFNEIFDNLVEEMGTRSLGCSAAGSDRCPYDPRWRRRDLRQSRTARWAS